MTTPEEKSRILKIVSILDTPAFNLIFGGIGILLFLLTYLGYINLILGTVLLGTQAVMVVIVQYLYCRYIDVDPPKDNASKTDKDPTDKQ